MKLTIEIRRDHSAFPLQYKVTVATETRSILFEEGGHYPAQKAQDAADKFVRERYAGQQIAWQGQIGENRPGNLVYRGTADVPVNAGAL